MTVGYVVSDGVAVITFQRPDVLNAFNDEMGAAALDAVTKASGDDSVRCIVVTGSGRAFSAGEDLGALAGGYERGESPPLGDTLVRRYNPLIRAITGAPKPVVAAVNGIAAGAGASVALACDHRVAVDSAKLILAFVKVGLIPDSGAVWFLTRMLGHARAYQVCASGDPIDAATASEWGLFDQVSDAETFEQSWRSFAETLASGPTRAYALTKELLYGAATASLDEQLEREIEAQTECGSSDDHMEGVKAFFERRPPVFGGK